MFRFLLPFVLAVLATCGNAAQTILYVGPDGRPAPAGKYWLIVTHDDGTPPTVTLALDTGTVTPPVVPPVVPPVTPPVTPPVDDLTAKIDGLIASVITDPTKTVTAKGISDGYKLALTFVESGRLTEADSLRTLAELGINMGLQQVGKTAAWKPYTTGMVDLTKPMDLPALVNAYKVASARLVDSQPNPPVTPPVNPPTTPGKPTAVTYVFEKDQAVCPRPVAKALQDINAAGLVVASEFEEDSVTGLNAVPTQYRVALEAARKVGLPALVVQSGDVVLKVVKDPKTEADVTGAMK